MENTISNKKYSAIILSAGKSSRMGVPKFSLKFNQTTTFIENLINEYLSFGCNEVVVVLNPDSAELLKQLDLNLPSKVKIVINEHPKWERFYSLKIAANALKIIKPVFVSNIDNPFVNQNLLNSLSNGSNEADYVNPVYNGRGGHPFLLSARVVADLIKEKRDQIHLKEFLGGYSKELIDVNDEKVLLNINTFDEYSRLFK